MEQNKVELIGKINWKNIEKKTNTTVAKFLVAKRVREGQYTSFPVTMFGDEATNAYKLLEKGDFAYFVGKLSMNEYVKDEKEVRMLEIVGLEAKKVTYDTDKKKYVEASSNEGVEDW